MKKILILTSFFIILGLSNSALADRAEKGLFGGALGGAAVGGIAGGGKGALIGGGLGAGFGYLVGRDADKRAERRQRRCYRQEYQAPPAYVDYGDGRCGVCARAQTTLCAAKLSSRTQSISPTSSDIRRSKC
ncbi:hypothetical protein BH09DEP1_BH09DEP1_7860 [soil metagenome]